MPKAKKPLPPDPTATLAWALRPRSIGLLAGKFVLCYAALLGLVYLLVPVIYPVFARAARDLLILGSGVPRISGLSLQESLPLFQVVFRIDTPLHAGPLFVREPALAFTLLFPLALILALPRQAAPQRWRRFAWVALAAVSYGAVVLAYVADNYLASVLARNGVRAHPVWREQLYAWSHTWSWSLSTIIFPLVASLYALGPLLAQNPQPPSTEAAGRAAGKVERRQARRRHRFEERERATRDRSALRRQLWAFVSILLLAVALDGLAQYRISALSSAKLASSLESLNADVGGWFLKVGQEESVLGRPGHAREGFAAARRYPEHAEAAAQAIRELEAPAATTSREGETEDSG